MYSTVKEVTVRSTFVAVLHRILQLLILIFVVFYIILIKKGYQEFQEPQGSSIIKIKGAAQVSIHNSNLHTDNSTQALWDAADYVVPSIETNAFFIATRKTVTYGQTQGICPSSLNNNLFCNSTYNPCKRGKPTPNAFGYFTGNCVPSQENTMINVCEINAWCPEELSNSTDYTINIDDLLNITVFIKTAVSFAQFNIKLRTVKQDTKFSCRFNSDTDPRCPIFQIGYIIKKLREKNHRINRKALYNQGGLIQIEQTWKCNFDSSVENQGCFPTYTFDLLQSGDDKLSPGVNFRFVEKYRLNEIDYRTTTKMYGLRFVLTISGHGGRFDIRSLFLAIGSGIGYMIIAELVSEFIFMRFHRHREEFRRNKIKVFSLKDNMKARSGDIVDY
ncbi:unnamed protein product [Rotaria sordida]|uniref:ATP receptor n=1 Tax=Rotaria sordida TaxID=392033 RepID=A0A815IXM9_9BILA|nr:unnamed protein product [Rotaria sordida]CAF1611961.1 unnamed protein product [Rotaria sordida]